jgi:hypothetical protein
MFSSQRKYCEINQLSFAHPIPNALVGPPIPVIDNSQRETENVGVRMYSSLMGTFDIMEMIAYINSISGENSSSMRSVPFCTSYFNDPWTLPSPTMSYEGHSHIRMAMPFSTVEFVYQDIQEAIVDLYPSSSWKFKVDLILEPIWFIQSYCSHDFLDNTLPSDEAILEAMSGPDRPWENMHHRSYFLPELVRIEQDEFNSTLSEMVSHTVVLLDMHGIYAEGNMENISPTIPIDIS